MAGRPGRTADWTRMMDKVLLAAAALVGLAAWPSGAAAGPCPPDALGVSRTLKLDTHGGFAVGLKTYPRTLALNDHEIVLHL